MISVATRVVVYLGEATSSAGLSTENRSRVDLLNWAPRTKVGAIRLISVAKEFVVESGCPRA